MGLKDVLIPQLIDTYGRTFQNDSESGPYLRNHENHPMDVSPNHWRVCPCLSVMTHKIAGSAATAGTVVDKVL